MISDTPYSVIALDGPAGSGKSTVASRLALRLGFIHADSGAMYRTVTLALMENLGALENHDDFGRLVNEAAIDFERLRCEVVLENGRQSNRIAGEDVGDRIRTPEVTSRIRYIADNPQYREAVNLLLRDFARRTDLIVDGRDIGSVVFPEAPYKFFLTASVAVRAERRLKEYAERGLPPADRETLEKEIGERDAQDRARPIGALDQAVDAILIDTSELDINGVVATMLSYLQIQF